MNSIAHLWDRFPSATMTRPTRKGPAALARNRQKVYSVRLSEQEEAEVQRVAAAKHLPPSTLVRSWILERLDQERPA